VQVLQVCEGIAACVAVCFSDLFCMIYIAGLSVSVLQSAVQHVL